jgi:predicted MPP superfamily phosphohydrolase
MEIVRRWLPLLAYAGLALAMQLYVLRWLAGRDFFKRVPWRRRSLLWAGRALALWVTLCPIIYGGNLDRFMPGGSMEWALAAAMLYGALLMSLLIFAWTGAHETDLARRRSVKLVLGAAAAVPAAAAGAGVLIARTGLQLREVDVRIPGLPKDLDGLRIAQLTDIHFGPFFGAWETSRAVAMANETRPHLAVVTGDLITRRGDNLRSCMKLLGALKAEAGVYGCHGNHENYAGALEAATLLGASLGIRYLRYGAENLRFGSATLRLAGVDYQSMYARRRYLTQPASYAPQPGVFNLLLSHNPDVFPRAAELGFELTLSGHTHGGQVNFEILHEHLNVARFYTPYTRGLYQENGKAVYVSAGLGTVAAPVRLGAPPEVTLIRLCAA